VLQQGHWLYIYGTTEDVIDGIHHKYMILARAPENGLENFDQWRFYDNGEWSTDFTNAERLCGGMANEFSVSFLPALERYIVVYSDGGSSENIVARFAPNPWGPWSDSMVLYRCPEQRWGESIFCYAAKGHPAISKASDEIIVTYIASSTDFETITTDARLYRPRFIRMRFRR
jgi:hypothetical protein